jgi:hypothetical protein
LAGKPFGKPEFQIVFVASESDLPVGLLANKRLACRSEARLAC